MAASAIMKAPGDDGQSKHQLTHSQSPLSAHQIYDCSDHQCLRHRVHFLDKASRDLFICAKDLFVGAWHGWPAKLRHREPVFGGRETLEATEASTAIVAEVIIEATAETIAAALILSA